MIKCFEHALYFKIYEGKQTNLENYLSLYYRCIFPWIHLEIMSATKKDYSSKINHCYHYKNTLKSSFHLNFCDQYWKYAVRGGILEMICWWPKMLNFLHFINYAHTEACCEWRIIISLLCTYNEEKRNNYIIWKFTFPYKKCVAHKNKHINMLNVRVEGKFSRVCILKWKRQMNFSIVKHALF